MKLDRLKEKARILLQDNIRTFIKDVYDNYYFCNIKEISPDWIILKNFSGKRNGEISRIFWVDILDIREYKEEGENL